MGKREVINVVTLGCSKNVVDSEHIMAQLFDAGFDLVADSNDTSARTVIINTCGFIGDAKEESVNTILEFVKAKEEGEIDRLFVIGCLSERYADELRQEIPEVDKYFGARNIMQVIGELGVAHSPKLDTKRYTTTPKHYAYLKVSEGCNWHCSYCAIPLIRGRHISIPIETLLEEARGLAREGVKELIVVGQDTTYYGVDIYGRRRLAELLKSLTEIEGIEWIRLHYTYPTGFPDDVIKVIRDEPKICKYIDMPLQHIADSQLSAMKRNITKQQTIDLLAELRRQIPDIAIRTTLLVGFAGETEEDFAELEEFVREQRFERLGVFPYSEEEGTYGAGMFEDDVPHEVKEERVGRIMDLQMEISAQANQKRVDKVMRVIVDSQEGGFWIARSQYDSPEVDQEILIPINEPLQTGQFYDVLVTGAEEYDLYGTTVIK